MTLFDLVAKITLDSSEYEQGLDGISKTTGIFSSNVAKKIGDFASTAIKSFAAVATSAIGAGTSIFSFVDNVATAGDDIDKMSQKLGMSATAYQEWDAIMRHSGTTIESMQSSMKTLASAAETGKDAFEELGISEEKLASLSQEDLFSETIKALQNVEDDTRRTYLAGQLLGRGATELGALLNTSAEDTEKMRKAVHDLGGVMSDDAVKASAAYKDSLQDMQTAAQGLLRGAVVDAIPTITKAFQKMGKYFSGPQGKTIQSQLSKIISIIANGVKNAIPKLLSLFDNGAIKLKVLTGAVAGFVIAVKATVNPVGALLSGLGLLAGGLAVAALTADDTSKKFDTLTDAQLDEIDAAKEASDALNEARDARIQSAYEIDEETKKLQDNWKELQTLAEKNDDLTYAERNRADYLLGELNNALGTEYEWNDLINGQYEDMAANIDNLIKKRQAERYLESAEESAAAAKQSIPEIQAGITNAQQRYDEYVAKLQEYADILNNKNGDIDFGNLSNVEINYLREVQSNYEELSALALEARGELEGLRQQEVDAYADITLAQDAYVAVAEGDYEKVAQLLENDTQNRQRHRIEAGNIDQEFLEELKHDAEVARDAYNRYLENANSGAIDFDFKLASQLRKAAEKAEQVYDEAMESVSGITSGVLDEMLGAVDDAEDAGIQTGEGFIKGLKSKYDEATKAAAGLGNGAVKALKTALDIKSPSRVTRGLGKFFTEGFSLGILDELDDAEDAAENVAFAAADALDGFNYGDDYLTDTYIEKTAEDTQGGAWSAVVSLLEDIRDRIGGDVVLDSGEIVGYIDGALGSLSTRKARAMA